MMALVAFVVIFAIVGMVAGVMVYRYETAIIEGRE